MIWYFFRPLKTAGAKNESIDSIKEYEANFFRKSRLFREGALKLTQMTTENMSKAVSERFWRMVKDSVEQEADTYRGMSMHYMCVFIVIFNFFQLTLHCACIYAQLFGITLKRNGKTPSATFAKWTGKSYLIRGETKSWITLLASPPIRR